MSAHKMLLMHKFIGLYWLDVNVDGKYEKDKERLANMMAFGQDIAPSTETSKVVRRRQKSEAESDKEVDRFQECKYYFVTSHSLIFELD